MCTRATFLDVASFSGIYFSSQHELTWPLVWPQQLWVTVPAGVGYSALLKNITWKNLVATSENLSSRDLCYSTQRRWGRGSFYLKTVVKCVYTHTGATHLFPKEVIIRTVENFSVQQVRMGLHKLYPALTQIPKSFCFWFFFLFYPLIHR